MALDLNAVKKRLNKLQSSNSSSSWKWRPEPDSESLIRIVPFKHQPDYPFIELLFHYNFGKTFLSPASFGDPDPVVEFAEGLKSTGERDDWFLARKVEPKARTYVPIVVRGEEDKGVKFYGFGKTVYEQLLAYIADEDYGDITDPQSGRDIKLTYKSKETTSKNYPETSIMIKPKETPLHDDAKVMKKLLEEQPTLEEVFDREWTDYETLEKAFQSWISKGGADDEASDSDDNDDDGGTTSMSNENAKKLEALFDDD